MSADQEMVESLGEPPSPRELTFGEKAVGTTFNPGGHHAVNEIKDVFAEAIDYMNKQREISESKEVKRMYSIAITEAQTAQMWAVKAATWKD
jgi:hypothetical protein